MDIRQITDTYYVSPQISADDAAEIAAAGFTRVICNRPDEENPPSHQSETISAAMQAAGLEFEFLPLTHKTMTPDNIARQQELSAIGDGKVLAYCASGTRCSVAWALSQAGKMPAVEILATTARAGYALDALAPRLDVSGA